MAFIQRRTFVSTLRAGWHSIEKLIYIFLPGWSYSSSFIPPPPPPTLPAHRQPLFSTTKLFCFGIPCKIQPISGLWDCGLY